MLTKINTGTWLPAWVPQTSGILAFILLFCAMVESATNGFDGSLLNGLNILPVYKDYFNLTPATTGLNTASVYIGKILGLWASGLLCDRLGRRPVIFWSSLGSIIGVIIMAAAQNIGMFVAGRAILGLFSSWASVAGAVYLSETFAARWRSWGVGILNNFYYVGALIAAGVTLGTSKWQSTWAWRAPCLFQGIFAIICIVLLPFIPESPRWLAAQGLHDDAHQVLASVNADGDMNSQIVLVQFKEIVDTLAYEKSHSTMSPLEMFKSKVSRRRLFIGTSPGWMSCIVGNIIASYYLGDELKTAGITNREDQLKANVVLNVWCLVTCLTGTQLAVSWGRKPTALLCQFSLTTFLFIIGGLSKMYASNPQGASQALVYGDVACIFLFQGAYSIAWTPLMTLYPPEILNYSIRANGYTLKQYCNALPALVLIYLMPIGLANIGWKMYFVNASWDVLIFIVIIFTWVETKGKTLEEIDEIFEGSKHSDAPNLAKVVAGQARMDHDAMTKTAMGDAYLGKAHEA
ncbi:general substrate transporter [Kockovaella imperatae]|uniref:General substrate transporter n=1 Tax=Kockovaella imperatae TaxID=4999 RepID=A0A1Y1UK85_9TREE|nr:general substrate transporter [Kockovaella imperatae]ORX37914.1 general substrate transporter [Kockovaella imperatae]